ncbi:MAG: FxLYD domain-containing protein [Candidatus Rokuibacteriota bacterium]
MRRTVVRLFAIVCALIVAALGSAQAQDGFRVTFEVDRTNPEQTQVAGTVYNDSIQDVVDVSVTAEALDARGKVVARGITYVTSRIPGRGSVSFVAKVPSVPNAVRYRASVSSYRPGMGSQAP